MLERLQCCHSCCCCQLPPTVGRQYSPDSSQTAIAIYLQKRKGISELSYFFSDIMSVTIMNSLKCWYFLFVYCKNDSINYCFIGNIAEIDGNGVCQYIFLKLVIISDDCICKYEELWVDGINPFENNSTILAKKCWSTLVYHRSANTWKLKDYS